MRKTKKRHKRNERQTEILRNSKKKKVRSKEDKDKSEERNMEKEREERNFGCLRSDPVDISINYH